MQEEDERREDNSATVDEETTLNNTEVSYLSFMSHAKTQTSSKCLPEWGGRQNNHPIC